MILRGYVESIGIIGKYIEENSAFSGKIKKFKIDNVN